VQRVSALVARVAPDEVVYLPPPEEAGQSGLPGGSPKHAFVARSGIWDRALERLVGGRLLNLVSREAPPALPRRPETMASFQSSAGAITVAEVVVTALSTDDLDHLAPSRTAASPPPIRTAGAARRAWSGPTRSQPHGRRTRSWRRRAASIVSVR
jgi:hypothetical protein